MTDWSAEERKARRALEKNRREIDSTKRGTPGDRKARLQNRPEDNRSGRKVPRR